MFPTREHIEAAQEAADFWKAKTGVYVWPSVTLAQALIESAGWTKLAGKNNGFGITEPDPAKHNENAASFVWTWEEIGGQRVKMQRWFKNFASLRDAYIEHGRVLATVKAYRAAWAAKDAQGFVQGIGKYATASNYRATIRAVMARLKLEQYDQPGAHVAPAQAKPPHPAVIPGAAAAGGAVIVAAAPHLSVPNLGMVAALVIVAAVIGVIAFIAFRRKVAADLAEVSAKPSPEIVKLLDEIAPLVTAT